MDEVENRTKGGLAVLYILNSLMIISYTTVLWLSVIIFKLETANLDLPFTIAAGFMAFMIIIFILLLRSVERLCDVIYKLNEGEYY